MKLNNRILKPILTSILLVLMIGTRVICDLGEVMSWSHMIHHEDGMDESQFTVSQVDNQNDRDSTCTDCPADPVNKQDHKQCCTNWFTFVAEPTRSSVLRASLNETSHTSTDTIISKFQTQEPAFIALFVLLLDNNYPQNLPYLPSHPLRV